MNGGGLQSLIATLVRRFAGTQIRTSVVSLDGKVGKTGASVAPLAEEVVALRSWPLVSMVAPLGLARLLRRLRPDVVHIHSGVWYKGAHAARLAGVRKVIFTEHGREHHDPALQRLLDRRASDKTDVVVAVSHRLAEYLERVVGVSRDRIRTIENGVDTKVFAPGATVPLLRERLGIPGQATVVGSIGRFETVKGYDRLLRVFRRLRAEEDPAHPVILVLCGDGSERQALQQLAGELRLNDRVRFAGWVQDPADFYRLLDVFTLTSRSEGLSISLLEALASGTVPVVNDVGANAEVLGPNLSGQVVPDGEWERFAVVLGETVRSPERRAELRAHGLARIAERYDIERMLTAYAALYGADLAAVPREGVR
jgi:glycosyltransferase involved in cell wall biosynthesis